MKPAVFSFSTLANPWIGARVFLVVLSGAFALVLGLQVINRLLFPWDHIVGTESAILTNLWKLSAGHPLYTAPADANSFVTSPALDYLCYAILAPFGVELDIRFCRVIVVALGLFAALVLALAIGQIARRLVSENLATRGVRFLSFFFVALVVFKNPMSDVLHPDNLQVLHFAIGMGLTLRALANERFSSALSAVAFLGLGALLKPVAALGCLGAMILFAVEHRKVWDSARIVGLVAVGLTASLISFTVLVEIHPYGKFYTIDLPWRQPINWLKLEVVFARLLGEPHRLVLFPLAIASAVFVSTHPNAHVRKLFRGWLVLGATLALPSALSFVKVLGLWNSLTVVDSWLVLIVLPTVVTEVGMSLSSQRPLLAAGFATSVVVLLVTLVPLRLPPSEAQFLFLTEVEAQLSKDVRAGHRVLLAHGTSMLLRAGVKELPRDRAISILELNAGGMADLAKTRTRIEEAHYTRIYLATPFFSRSIEEAIGRRYEVVKTIESPSHDSLDLNPIGWDWGFQPEVWSAVRILKPKLNCSSSLGENAPAGARSERKVRLQRRRD